MLMKEQERSVKPMQSCYMIDMYAKTGSDWTSVLESIGIFLSLNASIYCAIWWALLARFERLGFD
jgi:hypothetical protein